MAILETERLLIQPTTVDDDVFIFELLNSPKWLKYVGNRKIGSVADARSYIEFKMLPQFHEFGYSNNTVIRKEDGAKMGTIGLYHREEFDIPDIGFAFLPAFEGLGYALESTTELIKWAKANLEIKALNGITVPDNQRSIDLMLKHGFEYQKDFYMKGDEDLLQLYRKEL